MKKYRFAATFPLAMAAMAGLGCGAAASAGRVPTLAIQAPVPPPGFNPVTASDEDLSLYGFPPRPDVRTAPGAYATWRHVVTLPVKRVITGFRQTNIYNGPAQILSESKVPGTPATGKASSNWSGYAIVDSGDPFKTTNTTVYGQFVVPIAQQAFGKCTGGWNYSAQWVGIDGDGSRDVLQAGYEADAYCAAGTKDTRYSAWYEWYPNTETRLTNFPADPGDVIYLYIWPTSTTTGHYYITNATANKSTNASFSAPGGTSLTGNSVEWIVERPSIGGRLAALMNYINVPWVKAYAVVPGQSGDTQYSPGRGNGGTIYCITMNDNSGSAISRAFTSGDNGLTYVSPSGTESHDDGTALWFNDLGSAR